MYLGVSCEKSKLIHIFNHLLGIDGNNTKERSIMILDTFFGFSVGKKSADHKKLIKLKDQDFIKN